MTDRDDDGDPLLVRPYLLGEPGSTPPHASAQTWPEAAAEPAAVPESPDATVPIRLPAPPPRRGRRHRRPLVLLVAAALTLALLGAAALAASLLPEPRTPSALPIDAPLPTLVASPPAPATTAAPTVATPATTAATTRPRAVGSPPATPAPKTKPKPTTKGPSAVPATPTASPAVDQLAPPAADRIGRIHGNGGLCLDLNGALAVDGTQIQVFTCNDTAAQRWTVATDGTLRIVGKCAASADDGTVRLATCDARRAAQWRAGPDDILVNLATGDCLTDPSNGTQSGTAVRTEDCSAAERQRWELP